MSRFVSFDVVRNIIRGIDYGIRKYISLRDVGQKIQEDGGTAKFKIDDPNGIGHHRGGPFLKSYSNTQ
jgi:hypothetical protein